VVKEVPYLAGAILMSLGVMLIPLGTIQLLMWEKWGICTVMLGVLSLAFYGTKAPSYEFDVWGQIFFYLLCQVLLLCVSKIGVNSWKQLEYGTSFKKHKLLYFYFVILFLITIIQLGVDLNLYQVRTWCRLLF
jgi:hypothetical protein